MSVVMAMMHLMVPTTMMSAVVMMTSARKDETRRNEYREENRGCDEAVSFHGLIVQS